MTYPSEEFDAAVAALCHGTISDANLAHLHELLARDQAAQSEYLWRVELHVELADSELAFAESAAAKRAFPMPMLLMLGLVLLAAGFWAWRPQPVARLTQLTDAQWMTPDLHLRRGDAVTAEQRLELQAGTAELTFASGARMRITGPTIVTALGENSARLVLGDAHVLAESAASKGFVLVTPTSSFVDIGTAFAAGVAPDALSRLKVLEGEVDVVLAGVAEAPRLCQGETLYVEPGQRKIVTRIEPGDGTAAFVFPSIGPPSAADFADQSRGHASLRIAQGHLRERPGPSASGPPSVLLDGAGQSKQDAPLESAFFEDGVRGEFLLDLGQVVSIERINCYSWHQHEREAHHRHRARQRFILYGFAGSEPPAEKAAWTRIARVNSDRFFEVADDFDRPAQQVSSISAAEGEIGRYRYLLWAVQNSTFFGEIDVFGEPTSSGPAPPAP